MVAASMRGVQGGTQGNTPSARGSPWCPASKIRPGQLSRLARCERIRQPPIVVQVAARRLGGALRRPPAGATAERSPTAIPWRRWEDEERGRTPRIGEVQCCLSAHKTHAIIAPHPSRRGCRLFERPSFSRAGIPTEQPRRRWACDRHQRGPRDGVILRRQPLHDSSQGDISRPTWAHGHRFQRKQEWAFSGGCWRRLSDLLDSQNRRTRNGEQLRQFRQAVGRRSRHFNSPAIEQAVPIDGDLHHGAEEG